jgi:hypothetical protein
MENKKIRVFTLLVGLLLFNSSSFCQSLPFPQPGMAQGDVWLGNWSMPGIHNASVEYIKDTLVSGQTYSRFLNHFSTDFYTSQWGSKIYYYGIDINGAPSSGNTLLYDFDMNVGDTFNVNPMAWIVHCKVDSVYMVTLLNGQQRKYTRLSSPLNPTIFFRWIDGIGDIDNGFLVYQDFEGGHSQLVCAKDSSGLLYVSPNLKLDCDSLIASRTTSIFELESKNHTSVYPNPFTVSTNIEIDPSLNIQSIIIEILDVFGKRVASLQPKDHKFKMQRENLPSGIYFYKITSEDKTIGTGKLIIE